MNQSNSNKPKLVDPRTFQKPLCAEVGYQFFYIDDADDDTIPEQSKNVSYKTAIEICKMCEHTAECAEWGIYKEHWGVWGGLTPPQRSSIRRTRNIIIGE